MPALKAKEIQKMNKSERERKLKELKIELVKARASKTGNSKIREIKKIIARILTINHIHK